jgi:hypothetical protein
MIRLRATGQPPEQSGVFWGAHWGLLPKSYGVFAPALQPLSRSGIFLGMTEEEIAEMKLKDSLLQAMKRNPGTGVRVTIDSFVAAAELVKHDQAECYELGGRLYIREWA